MTDEGILHVKPTLQRGLRETAGCADIHIQRTARQNLRIQRLQQGHIDGSAELQVDLLRAGQMGAAVGGEIGSAAGQMEALDERSLIGDFEADWINGFDLHMLDLCAERLYLSGSHEIARGAQRAANVDRSADRSVAGDFTR